jgi:hypothetical protein
LTCLIYRGEFAVVPGRNEMYVWVVDVQPTANGNPPADEGIWQSTNGGTSWTQIPDNGITNCGDERVWAGQQRLRRGTGLVQPGIVRDSRSAASEFNRNGCLRGRGQSLQVHAGARRARPARKATGSI